MSQEVASFLVADGDQPGSQQQSHLFIMLKPNGTAAEQIYQRAGRLLAIMQMEGRPRPPELLHVTLLGIGCGRGRAPDNLVSMIRGALEMVRFPAFDVEFDRAMSFRSSSPNAPFVLASSDWPVDIIALHLAVRAALQIKGFHVSTRALITPHMTLSYDPQRRPAMAVSPILWRASHFRLVESWVGRTQHVELGSWPLCDS